ncbi:MAG: hypothetical protein JWQ96_2639 [Segetibacter sp.]|nr:hypothetical protein [Segetibacter sp.]
MKSFQIELDQWSRIFFGQAPGLFYIELLFRCLFIYILLIASMRMLGKRMQAQMDSIELAALATLAAAVGVPLLALDRGLLPAVIICAIVITITRTVSHFSYKSQKFEDIAEGNIGILVKDGVMDPKEMMNNRITRERLCSQLRQSKIYNLGMVKRLYLEASGGFSIIKSDMPKPGLLVLPEWDKDFVGKKVKFTNETICVSCGKEQNTKDDKEECSNCRKKVWTKAVTDINA